MVEQLGIIIMFLTLLEESTWSQTHVDFSETFVGAGKFRVCVIKICPLLHWY